MAFSNNYYYGFKDYVSVAERRQQAAHELAKLNKKGRKTSPIVIDGRKIATTFWGKAWCDNLERYSDYANRLPRGRSYVRNGTVVDLQIAPGAVTALVSGSRLYTVKIDVKSVARTRWQSIRSDCSGAIDSVIELLQGRLSDAVMARLCDQTAGLFPSPADIAFSCSCPDWASMCKHVAAALYGIGARLDHRPELLFTLRQVAHEDLIAKAGAGLTTSTSVGTKVLADEDLSAMFGIEIAPTVPKLAAHGAKGAAKDARAAPAGKPQPVSVHIAKSRSAAARMRATKPRSPLALKRAIAKQLKSRGEEIRRSRKP
jgi:uncharacterized Zn finger protein